MTNSSESKANPYAIFRNRDVLFYMVARFLAAFGQQMLSTAIGWDLYERTNSVMALGMVGLCQFLPMVLMTLPAGHVADRYDRRNVVLSMEAFLFFTSVALGLISIFKAPVSWIYICLFLVGMARTFLWSSNSSFLPQLVSKEDFPQAVNWSSSTFQFSAVTGPAVAGMLISHFDKASPIYLINAIMIACAFLIVYLIKARHKPSVNEEASLEFLLGGFHFVFKSPLILAAITLDLFAVLFGGATALLPVYAKDILKVGASGLGLLQSALPVGSLVCALVMAHRPPIAKAGKALFFAVLVFGLATIGFGVSKSFPLSLLMLFICGFADYVSVIIRHTLVQLHTPDEMRGRVSAVNGLFIGTSNQLGEFESGVAAAHLGTLGSVVTGGLATILVVFLVFWRWPQLRRYGQLGSDTKNN